MKYFKELSIHPENILEVKGLILELAVRGELTTTWRRSNSEVEPASILLDRIRERKKKLIAEKKIKKEKKYGDISKEEKPFNIDDTWEWCYLGEIGSTNVGLTYKPFEISESGTPVLRSSNIQNGQLYLENLIRVNSKYREKDIIRNGDLLICARNGSRRLVGKCAIIESIQEEMVFGAFMAIFRSELNPYIKLFIESPVYRSSLEGVSTTTINQITQSNLKSTLVPLPPLQEQKAIVQIVDQLLQEVEQLEKLTRKRLSLKEKYVTSVLRDLTTQDTGKVWPALKANFKTFFDEEDNVKQLREAILQLAVQGKLTARWRRENPGVESAAVLLEGIKTDKAKLILEKKIKKEKVLPPISIEETPYELPMGWVWCRMGDIVLDIEAGKSPKCLPTPASLDQWGVIKMSAITWGEFNEKENKELPDNIEPFRNKEIKPGDFILTRANTAELIAKSVVVKKGVRRRLLLNDKTLRFHFDKLIHIEYINLFNNSLIARGYYMKVASGTSDSMKNISRSSIKLMPVPLPPLEEQEKIVETLNDLMPYCNDLCSQILEYQNFSERLMQSSLSELFTS